MNLAGPAQEQDQHRAPAGSLRAVGRSAIAIAARGDAAAPDAPRGPGAALRPAARALGARADTGAMAGEVSATVLRACYAERAADPDFVAALQRSVRDNIATILDLFAGRVELSAAPGGDALAFADLTATLGIPIATLERCYVVGAADFWRLWFDRCQAEADEHGVALDALVREPTMLLFRYVDQMLSAVVARYERTHADMVRTREHLRRSVLDTILAGAADETAVAELERGLAYPPGATHVAVSLEAQDRAEADRLVAGCRAACGAGDVLVRQDGARRFTAWFARRDGYRRSHLIALRVALESGGGRAAVSEPWAGVAGLRRAHEEVVMALGVQRAIGVRAAGVVSYREVRLDALLLADPERAQRFLREELGELAGPDPRLGLVREALLVWLSTGSHVSAAALLGVHENTVRNRVRRAEELLPGGVTLDRRTELQVALRLMLALGGASEPDVAGDRRRRR